MSQVTKKCAECPREGELQFKQVENFGVGQLTTLEEVYLCEYCAMMHDDILDPEWREMAMGFRSGR
jgi:protein-arginine kinase activator protein McsA